MSGTPQLVYTVIQPHRYERKRCSPLPSGAVSRIPPRPRFPRVLFGEIAQYDEAEDDVEDGYVAVRVGFRGRVIAAPLHEIRAAD